MAASTGGGGTAAAATGEPAHAVSLLRGLSALRAERSLLDVTVVAGGREFGAHRAVLAAASGYFRAMFGGALREARAERVRLHGVEPECLARLLDFAYTGRVGGLGPDIAERLLRAADLLQFPAVKEACGAWLARQLEPANALDMQDFAEAFACPALAAAAHRFVLRHVGELGAQLERLPLPRLLSYLRDDGLCVPKEEAAFQLALRWVRADPAARAPLLPQLLAHVRLPFVRRFYLLAHVEGEPLVARCPPCLRLLREARDFQAARLDRHDRGPCARMRPRPSTGLAEILVLVGGCDRDCDELVTVDCYNPRTGHWRYLAEFPEHLGGGYSVAALGNDIYVTGFLITYAPAGVNEIIRVRDDSAEVDVYNPTKNEWDKIPAMLQVHVGGSVAVLGGKLYVSGGYDNTFELSDVLEAYDPETRTWSVVGRLPEPIFWHGSVSIFRQFMPETTQEDDSITLDNTINLNRQRQNLHDQNLNELR
ncbi:kelch-like protein 21 [Limosa lapponica baueri]|uniref:Kelch-like protein 21 n=1 Tax=Limosa lapponica baueri TaxID=1758121 RepID=A0A2I0TMN9_LIMLA|nr:kelch-like protein 21 [Limosa lapponica baueri]